MPLLDKLPRAFVSYSRQDDRFVQTLAADLRKHGIEVWIDFEGLKPGTPDWEAAIRESIEESFALLLICSPESQKSVYVRSELLVAQARCLPVFALWASGEAWIDSVPMSLAHIQYSDFRAGAYQTSLSDLVRELRRLNSAAPQHFVYNCFYSKVKMGSPKPRVGRWCGSTSGGVRGSFDVFSKPRPGGFMEIQFEDILSAVENCDSADTLFVRPSSFKTAAHLLDAIYINYFADRYPPFSYGRQWHLRRGYHPTQLAIDWKLLNAAYARSSSPINVMQESPEDHWFVAGSQWVVSTDVPDDAVALGAYDNWLIDAILQHPKAAYFLIPELMRPVDAKEFGATKPQFVAVATNFVLIPQSRLADQFFVQVKDCVPEVKARWSY